MYLVTLVKIEEDKRGTTGEMREESTQSDIWRSPYKEMMENRNKLELVNLYGQPKITTVARAQ